MAYKALVKKVKIPAIVRTNGEKVVGFVHLLPESRILDLLNDNQDCFIPVSDARVYDNSGDLLYEVDFMAMNKRHIVTIAENGPAQSE